MSDDTLNEVYDSWGREDDKRETKQKFVECLICGEKYDIDEGCCLIDS